MAKIKVFVGELTKPLKASSIDGGTTLADFLKKKNYKYSAAIRVNGRVAAKNSILHANDIVYIVGEVSGGR